MDGAQHEKLYTALLDAFDRNDLTIMLKFRLNRRLDAYVSESAFKVQVFQLMQKAEMEGWLLSLVVQASQYQPGSASLLQALQEFDVAPVPRMEVSEQYAPFERMIEKTNPFLSPLQWIEQAGRAMRRVCHIVIPRRDGTRNFGTGFLVGPEVVLTNYHVIEPLLKEQAISTDVQLRFDYCEAPNGHTVFGGVDYRLRAGDGWLVDHSQYDPADLNTIPANDPNPDCLDYALLCLEKPAGNHPAGVIGQQPAQDAPPRGWIVLPLQEFGWADNPHMPLLILQHPSGGPMKLAYRSDGQIEVNGNGTRVRYAVNTEKGASGSLCFTKEWEPVALHHAGDPNYSQMARYNQGIPLSAVAARIRRSSVGMSVISVPPTDLHNVGG